MKTAYVDTSCVLAVAFTEPRHERQLERLGRADRLLSSNLLEAEFRSALARESAEQDHSDDLLEWISWVLPERALQKEFLEVLAVQPLRGADLWHLACAVYLRRGVDGLVFLSLDRRQLRAARQLGFPLDA